MDFVRSGIVLCGENKRSDQLHGYRSAAPLFLHMQKESFHDTLTMSPPCKGRETYCFSPCVHPSVRLSVPHKIVSTL